LKKSAADDRMKAMSGLRFIQKIALLAIFTAAFVLPFFNLPAATAAQTGLSAQTGDYFQNLQNQQNALRTQIKEKEETLKKLQEQEKNLNNQIKTAQKKETTLKNQINQFDQRIQKLAVDIEITETKISQHQLRIRELNLEIKRSEEIIQRNKKNLAELVRTIQSYDHANLLEILLRNKNFSDFLSQTERVQQLQRETQKRLEEIKLAKLKLGGEKTETESEKAELERLTQELDGQKAAAENQKTEKKNLFKITKNQEKNYQKLLSQVEKQQLEIQQGILDLEDKLRFAIDPSKIPAPRPGVLNWPQKGVMSQGYGPTSQTGFTNDAYKFHNGIDVVGNRTRKRPDDALRPSFFPNRETGPKSGGRTNYRLRRQYRFFNRLSSSFHGLRHKHVPDRRSLVRPASARRFNQSSKLSVKLPRFIDPAHNLLCAGLTQPQLVLK